MISGNTHSDRYFAISTKEVFYRFRIHSFDDMRRLLNRIPSYWLYQALGWGLFLLINLFFAVSFDRFNAHFVWRMLIFFTLGIALTHLMRRVIQRLSLLQRPLNTQIAGFLLLTLGFALAISSVDHLINMSFSLWTPEELNESTSYIFIANFINAVIILVIWNMIYFIQHYISASQKQKLDTLRLQALVKELELKTIKSHINPHFIFNALNSIRALIDENPSRARDAITELSNILRSSMQAENVETVPLTRELDIVRDYLALEHIRFEERLKVEYEIDERTLNHPVPFMMLQTLVENAIKHGIGRNVAGGTVKIISGLRGGQHELIVRNTGHLNGGISREGFGLQSTANRLDLLFGPQAGFQIHDLADNTVEARVTIPVQNGS
jgi:two-component system, LytTR family, sensor kinase